MRIAIMGAGGIGSYYGARLQAGGADVTFVARGEHLRAMQQNGLTVDDAARCACPKCRPPTIPPPSRRLMSHWSA